MADDGPVSILTDIRNQLPIADQDDSFDSELIIHINTALGELEQIGCGIEGFHITGDDETWDEFKDNSPEKAKANLYFFLAKSYAFMRVRLIFDAPATSTGNNNYSSLLDTLLGRLRVEYGASPIGGTT